MCRACLDVVDEGMILVEKVFCLYFAEHKVQDPFLQ